MSRLIFIEGISGVGKSTLSRALLERLRVLGEDARLFLEGDPDSPLDLFHAAYLTRNRYEELLRTHPALADMLRKKSVIEADYALVRYQSAGKEPNFPEKMHRYLKAHEFCFHPEYPLPLQEYGKVFRNLWNRFAESEEKAGNLQIFDGSLFHHQINDLLRNYHASREQIATHVGALARAVLRFNPMVFYLSTRDVGKQLTKACQDRGQAPPTDEQITFWKRRKATDTTVLKGLPVESHVMDFTNWGWDIALERIVSRVVGRKMEEAH